MKYNFELDLISENSLSIILNRIRPRTTILEFGPANGRLTKFLKKEYNCNVYIVEIDERAGLEAGKYAADYIIGNIEDYSWLNQFSQVEFDYILFADVLEHLYNPWEVLLKSSSLLKEDGSILISLPNIAHNSVIIDLINNKFYYRKIGLLDDTHIRFFTYESAIEMINKSKLTPVYQTATYVRVGDTELGNSYEDIDPSLLYGLLNKPFGEVYQFIFEAKKTSFVMKNSIEKVKNIVSVLPSQEFKLYFDYGSGFNEHNTISKRTLLGRNQLVLNLQNVSIDKVELMRLDPIDRAAVIKINDIYFTSNNNKYECKILKSNASIKINNILLFEHNDPQIWISFENNKGAEILIIDIEIYLINQDQQKLIKYIFNNKNKEEIMFRESINERDQKIINLNNIIRKKEEYINNCKLEIDKKEEYINKYKLEIDKKEEYINKYKLEIDKKEEYINKYKLEIGYQEEQIVKMKELLSQKENEIEILTKKNNDLEMKITKCDNLIRELSSNTMLKMIKSKFNKK